MAAGAGCQQHLLRIERAARGVQAVRMAVAPLLDALCPRAQQYPLTHEGGTDHDWLDAWLAKQLGAEPKPRLWEIANP
jgi:hypothetical protein